MKKNLLIVLIAIIIVSAIGIGIIMSKKEAIQETEKNIEIIVYDNNELAIYEDKVSTKSNKLLTALKEIENLEIVYENSQYGAFIISINSIKQENDYYWNYYVNGEYVTVGISDYEIKNNDKFEFHLEKFE